MHEVDFTDLFLELPPGVICSQKLVKVSNNKMEN